MSKVKTVKNSNKNIKLWLCLWWYDLHINDNLQHEPTTGNENILKDDTRRIDKAEACVSSAKKAS